MNSETTPIFAGVDGGGTNTRALLVAADGTCLALATGGSSNINTAGPATAAANIEETLLRAATNAATAKTPATPATQTATQTYSAAFFAMAGVNDTTAQVAVSELVRGLTHVKFARCEVANDTRGLHAATFGGGSGVVLIVGTGSKCYGRTADGREWEAGGVDFLVSDEGSAHDIAVRGIKAALRAIDGRGPATALQGLIFDALQLKEYGQISQRLHQDSLQNPGQAMTKAEIGALARFVTQACADGDAVARRVVEEALDAAIELAVAVSKKLGIANTELQVGITGGVILNEPGATIFRERLQRALPGARTLVPQIPPVAGAALRALALGGVQVTPEIAARLAATLPAEA